MATRTTLILFFAFALIITGCNKKEINKKMIVKTQAGLIMREAPDTSSKKVTLIPYGEEVDVIENQTQNVEINGIPGNWARVTWNGNTAWVFGGFLKEKEINTPDSAIEKYYKMEITLDELVKKYKKFDNDESKYERLVKNDLIENYKSITTGTELNSWINTINASSLYTDDFTSIYSGVSETKIINKKEEKIKQDEIKVILTSNEDHHYNLLQDEPLETLIKNNNVKNMTQAEFNQKIKSVGEAYAKFKIFRTVEETFYLIQIKDSWFIKDTARKIIESNITFI